MKIGGLARGAVIIAGIAIGACVHEPIVYPEPPVDNPDPGCDNDGVICFESSVLPIFLSSCARSGCHDSQSREEDYVLDSYANIIKRGITPGNANNSKLYNVLFAGGEDRMPPDGSLTQAQKDSIKVWINEGAPNTVDCNCFCDTTQYTFDLVIGPILKNSCVGCHEAGSLGGNIDLSTYAKVVIQADNGKLLGSVSHDIGFSPMPKGGKLSDCEITQIRKWIEAGALDN